MAAERLTIIVSGMIAGVPGQGGATWAVLQYVLGLQRLGHIVYLVEPMDSAALRPHDAVFECSTNAAYFRRVTTDFGLTQTAALLRAGTPHTIGVPYERLRQVARHADLLINISGMLTDEALIGPIRRRIYLDLDPGFTQLWQLDQGIDMHFANYTHFATIGVTLDQPTCTVPTGGLPWITTLQPVVLAYWPVATEMTYDALTTVGNWRSYGSIEYQGRFYGQKAHSLRRLLQLPKRVRERFLLALTIHASEQADLAALAHHGWALIEAQQVAATPAQYHSFIQGSKAEFGVAKSGYVVARCGWFSDRSVCYLASGRPVIAQETGFSRYLPTGAGLFVFETSEDVVASIGEWIYRAGAWEQLYSVVPTDDQATVAEEVERQLDRFRRMVGRNPTHLDSHQHVHRSEPVASIVRTIAQQLAIPLRHDTPAVHYCGDFYGQTGKGVALPDAVSVERLIAIIQSLPLGCTELGCHPGAGDDVNSMYRGERAVEQRTLCDPRLRTALLAADIELCSF